MDSEWNECMDWELIPGIHFGNEIYNDQVSRSPEKWPVIEEVVH